MRQHWRELDYWNWLWRQRTPGAAKLAIVGIVFAAVLVGGWFVADGLTAAKAGTGADSVVLETTVKKLVTVREKGKLVTKLVPVVKRVVRVQSQTQTQVDHQTDLRYSTRVVTEPGGTRVVKRVVTTRVPVVKNHVVTVNGKTKTVATTSYVSTTKTETEVQTQTQRQTVTDTQTAPGGTITQTSVENHTTTATTTQIVPTTIPTTVEVTTTVVSTNVVTTVETTTVVNTETVTETVTTTVPLPPAPAPGL